MEPLYVSKGRSMEHLGKNHIEPRVQHLPDTAYMGQLNLPPLFWNVSHLKIFPLELLGPAMGFSAGPSSCKGKILRWDTTTNSPTTNKCLILDVCKSYLLALQIKPSKCLFKKSVVI